MNVLWRAARIGWRTFWPVLVAWFLPWIMVVQSLRAASASCPKSGAPAVIGAGRVLREINDPHSGERWLLLPNAADPAGPAQWIRSDEIGWSPTGRNKIKESVVIHRGDRVVVEERGETVAAWLEATALEPAAVGCWLSVRLKIGGRVLRAVAIAEGRAEVKR